MTTPSVGRVGTRRQSGVFGTERRSNYSSHRDGLLSTRPGVETSVRVFVPPRHRFLVSPRGCNVSGGDPSPGPDPFPIVTESPVLKTRGTRGDGQIPSLNRHRGRITVSHPLNPQEERQVGCRLSPRPPPKTTGTIFHGGDTRGSRGRPVVPYPTERLVCLGPLAVLPQRATVVETHRPTRSRTTLGPTARSRVPVPEDENQVLRSENEGQSLGSRTVPTRAKIPLTSRHRTADTLTQDKRNIYLLYFKFLSRQKHDLSLNPQVRPVRVSDVEVFLRDLLVDRVQALRLAVGPSGSALEGVRRPRPLRSLVSPSGHSWRVRVAGWGTVSVWTGTPTYRDVPGEGVLWSRAQLRRGRTDPWRGGSDRDPRVEETETRSPDHLSRGRKDRCIVVETGTVGGHPGPE